ncbi:MAG: hypothetical protein JXQ99_10855 [Hyphomicrobiaceae bacterium]
MRTKQITDLAHWFEAQSEMTSHSMPERLMLENVSRWLRKQQSGAEQIKPVTDPWIGLSV